MPGELISIYLPPASEATGCSHHGPARRLFQHDGLESFYNIIKSTEELWESTELTLQEVVHETPVLGAWGKVRLQMNSIRESCHHSRDTQDLCH